MCTEYSSPLWNLLRMFPNEDWDWEHVSENDNLPIEILMKKPYWHGKCASNHPNLTMKIVLDNPDFPWDWFIVSSHENIKWNHIHDNPNLPWDSRGVSKNKNITPEIVSNNPGVQWDYKCLSTNHDFSISFVMNNLDRIWDLSEICAFNTTITWKYVCDNPNFPWNYRYLAHNPCITLKIICDNPDMGWGWEHASANPSISIECILNNPDKRWNLRWVSANPNLRYHHLKKLHEWADSDKYDDPIIESDQYVPLKGFTWEDFLEIGTNGLDSFMCSATDDVLIDKDYIFNNLDKDWDWTYLSYNIYITEKDILDHPNLPWSMFHISRRRFT